MRLAFAVSILLMVPAIAETQSATLAVGARVRVTSPSDHLRKHVTTVMELRGDSIVVGVRGSSRTIGLADVTVLEVSTGTRNRFFRDAGLGLGIGVIVGAVAGAVTYEECVPRGPFDCLLVSESSTQAAVVGGGIVLGAVGLAAGAVVGAFHRTDRWAPVRMPVRAAIAPTRSGGVSFTISRAF